LTILYRIFTENVNQDKIEQIVNRYFYGFTLIKSDGYWRLQRENSLIIEIVTDDTDNLINQLAREIKDTNDQEAVLIQKIKNNQWLV